MSEVEELKNRLFYKRENAWDDKTGEQLNNIFAYAEGYINFLNKSKTEREIVANAKEIAESNGFRCICEYETLSAGDKVYYINREKSMYLAVIGKQGMESGINIVGAHADSPRLDLKPNPLYEEGGFAYFKTHYYGGIKKYQWTTIPLSIHGVVVKANGEKIYVNV